MRLAVIGPQNTGKSTFIKDFIKAFPNYKTPQKTYRDVISKRKLSINQKSTEKNQKIIRDFLYKQISENKQSNILFDRSVIDNYIYSLALYDKGEASLEFLNETFDLVMRHLDFFDGVILIPTAASIKLVSDNLRDVDVNYIDKINRYFIKTLLLINKTRPLEVFVISGSREERIKLAGDIHRYMNYKMRL